MAITKLSGVLWANLAKVGGIAKASIVKVNGISAGPPIQTATLSATKYGLYTALSTTSWTLVVNAASSINNSTSSLSINSQVVPSRTGTNYINTRVNLQFDLSSFSTSSILSASLKLDVSGITTTAPSQNKAFVLDLGDTFDFPTLNNANYSLYLQSGSLTGYATDTIYTTGLYELNFSAAAITEANTFPAAYSMALLTYHDAKDTAPFLNEQYTLSFNSTPELEITYQ
jgi:hypothetical protein